MGSRQRCCIGNDRIDSKRINPCRSGVRSRSTSVSPFTIDSRRVSRRLHHLAWHDIFAAKILNVLIIDRMTKMVSGIQRAATRRTDCVGVGLGELQTSGG